MLTFLIDIPRAYSYSLSCANIKILIAVNDHFVHLSRDVKVTEMTTIVTSWLLPCSHIINITDAIQNTPANKLMISKDQKM